MAVDPSDNKRKRGRPPNAPRRDADASTKPSAAAEGYDADADDAERPKKRGRPSRSMTKATEPIATRGGPKSTKSNKAESRHSLRMSIAPAVENGEKAPAKTMERKRGRPRLANDIASTKAAETDERASRMDKRRLRDSQDQEQKEDASRVTSAVRGRPRRRQESPQQEADEEPSEPSIRRKRGRPREDRKEEGGKPREKPAEETQPKSRKRRRPSLKDMPPMEIQNRSPNPTRKDPTSKPKKTETKGKREASKVRGRGLARESKEAPRAKEDERIDDTPAQEQGTKRKRRRSGQDTKREADDQDNPPPSPDRPYTHIAPHIIHVRQSTIKAKWSTLGESSLAAISSILNLAHRPILQRLSNTQQRRSHTSAALNLITNRITRKISRGLPFPPAAMAGPSSRRKGLVGDDGRSAELDFESVLDAKQALERQLDPALHAVELLTGEKQRLERELERDYEVLRSLETNARSEAREHRGLLKKAHVLAPTPDGPISRWKEARNEAVFVHQGATSAGGLFDNLADEEEDVKTLALQLGSHMDSLRNNLSQTGGILPQVSRSRAALQDVLSRYLDQERYEQVMLG